LAFIAYVSPFLEFQSTQAYLKDPPTGWTLDAVDIFGGLSQIAQNLRAGAYKNQWAFEKDLFTLVNILPRDFHLNLPLPLIRIFTFSTQISLVSVSLDGLSLPQLYSASMFWPLGSHLSTSANEDDSGELAGYVAGGSNSTTTPSHIVSIDGEPAADYVLRIGLKSQQYQDPDAIYNLAFFSIPLAQQNNGDAFNSGGHLFGFSRENTTYVFANGTTLSQGNLATLNVGFDGVDSGAALFTQYEAPSSDSASDSGSASPNSTSTISTTTSVYGYPTPVVLHRDGYTGGYFLNNSGVAVLAINAFANPSEADDANTIQQTVIKQFLASCKAAGKTKLIVDLQGNGGGHIENGYDTFKQLFPTMEPFGATRFRSTPLVQYFSEFASEDGVYNYALYSEFQVQAVVDENLEDFPNYKDFVGPEEIYGDNFTALMRYNLSDPTIQLPFVISGYYNNSNIAPQLFAAEDIVILYDGACGSTCAIFSEFMKSQAGVRSIAVGGRPQAGPMQGVAGSKGYAHPNPNHLSQKLTHHQSTSLPLRRYSRDLRRAHRSLRGEQQDTPSLLRTPRIQRLPRRSTPRLLPRINRPLQPPQQLPLRLTRRTPPPIRLRSHQLPTILPARGYRLHSAPMGTSCERGLGRWKVCFGIERQWRWYDAEWCLWYRTFWTGSHLKVLAQFEFAWLCSESWRGRWGGEGWDWQLHYGDD
jgi:hypothetical protein